MSGRGIVHRRLRNLRLTGTPLGSPEEVLRLLCAAQSQDFGPAKWSIGQRTAGTTEAEVDRAFADGRVLRTHVLRPTWHFVLPEDIRWLLALTGPRVHALNAYYYRRLGLDDDVLRRTRDLIVPALAGGNWLTRKELATVLAAAGIDTASVRLGYILMHAELDGVICSGPPRGRQQTYALLDERAPDGRSLSPEEALAELTRRYFTGHGPATVKDFRWWSSLTVAEIRRGLEMVGQELVAEVVDGVEFWSAPSARFPKPDSPMLHLLQGYDEYIVGYSESKRLLDTSGVARSLAPGTAVFTHVAFLDGQVAGHWKRTVGRDGVRIELRAYTPFAGSQVRALEAEARRHGEFLGLPASVATAPI
jgi:hypothetical protein